MWRYGDRFCGPVTNIHEAKTHFSKLVERAEAGEEIVIGRAGKRWWLADEQLAGVQ